MCSDIRVGPLATCAVVSDTSNPEPRIVVSRREGAGPGKPQYRWRLINWARALVGDRVIVHLRDGIAGLVIRGCAYHPPRRTGGRYVLYLDGARGMRLHVKGKPKSRLRRTVERPEIPAAPGPLIGPLMPHIGCPDSIKLHPMDCYFEALDRVIVPTGCNYLSVCPIAYWTPRDIGSPFSRSNGKYDLSTFGAEFRRVFRTFLWRAARQRVAVHIYPFDFVAFNNAESWRRSPLYHRNNIHGWFTEEAPRGYKGLHRALKDSKKPPEAWDYLTAYFQRMSLLLDGRHSHAVVPVLEGQSRRVDLNLSRFRSSRPLGVNNKDTYRDHAWPAMEGHLRNDPAWRELLRAAGFVSCHSCDVDTVERIWSRLAPFAADYDFGLLASTDGTGSGHGEASKHRRPQGTRPNVDDLVEIWRKGLASAGERFRGLEIKTLGWDDALATLPAVVARIQN